MDGPVSIYMVRSSLVVVTATGREGRNPQEKSDPGFQVMTIDQQERRLALKGRLR